MKIHDIDQGSEEWLNIRAGIVTASEVDALISPEAKPREGQGVETYFAHKLAERWLGAAIQTEAQKKMTWAMDQGHILEERAIPAIALDLGIPIRRVGFISLSEEAPWVAGASPDGVAQLIGSIGFEIKCPSPSQHVKYLLAGGVPKDYRTQVQMGLAITGWAEWRFVSYCRDFPLLMVKVERDEAMIKTILATIEVFEQRLREGMARLEELNGGPLERGYYTTIQSTAKGEVVTQTLKGAKL